MNKPITILVVMSRSTGDPALLAKALRLARQFDAGLELFHCDAEHAYALQHAYERSAVESVKRACISEATDYLDRMRLSVRGSDVPISVNAVCETPLYEGIVRKARQSRPVLVMKHAGGADQAQRATFDPNDWQLMRTCPTTLLITRGRRWRSAWRVAVAIDASEEEKRNLSTEILRSAAAVAYPNGADLDLLYAERESAGSAASRSRETALKALAREAHLDSAQVHVLAGEAEQALPAFARNRDYDVLVMGALTHREGLTPLVGTLTSTLVDALECDFMLVKAETTGVPEARGGVVLSAIRDG